MSPAQFLLRVKRAEIAPAYLFLGSEAYERCRCRDALLNALLPSDEREQGLAQHDLTEVTLAEVVDDARALSLFAMRRVILIHNAEAALPKGAKVEYDDDEAGPATSSGDELAAYLRDPSPGVVLLFEATRFDFEGEDKKKLERVRKFYSAIPDTVELKRFSIDEARGEAQTIARRAKVALEPAAAELLVEALGGDVARIATEMEKLALYSAGGKTITLDDIGVLIPDARATTIFILVNALGRRDRARSLQALDTLCRDGEYLPLALSFLSTQFRMALVAKEAGLKTAAQIQGHFTKLGVPMWGSKAEQVYQSASKFSKSELESGLKLTFSADRDLRSARPDDRIIMEEFVVRLTAL
ncbi:MAG: DNA polymerase III subunit delta [Acidobacteriota bacterium]|nr:DNA polymerase III subunit delta [Acidobacteriota bacterium]